MKTYAAAILALVVLASCHDRSSPSPLTRQDKHVPKIPPPPPPTTVATGDSTNASTAAVDLEESFLIPDAKISHTPSVVFTADGKRMITATSDGQVIVFDVATKKIVKTVKFPEEGGDAVSIDSSGRFAVWTLKKGGLAVLEIESGKIVARDEKLAAGVVAVAPDAKSVAIANGKKLELRELPSLKLVRTVDGHEADITNAAWSRDGKLLGSTAQDGRLLVIDAKRAVYTVKKPGPLYALAFAPSGGFIAYGGQEMTIYQYEFATEREEVIAKGQPFWITCLGYSPDGEMLAAGDESCDIWLFKVKTKQMTFHNKHHNECWLNSIAWAPDNETFLFGCRPNSYAGKPAVMDSLTYAEASRSGEVRGRRDAIVKAIDEKLTKTTDDQERKKLEECRKSLEAKSTEGAMMFGAEFSTDSDEGGKFALSGSTHSIPNIPQDLPADLRKLVDDHNAALQLEVKRLQSNYCVNQWRVKR